MKRLAAPLVVLTILASSAALADEWAQEMFKNTDHDFGTIARDAKAEFEFSFQNLYADDVRVASLRTSCGCTSVWVKDNKRTLKSWETGTIVAHINSDKFLGSKGATITVTFDKPYYAEAQLHVRTYIRDDVVLNPGSVQFGSVDQGSQAVARVAIGAAGNQWQILQVRSENPHLKGDVSQAGRNWGQTTYHLTVQLDKDAPAGYLHDHLILVTNDPGRSQIPVLVEGRVTSSITVGPRVLSLGMVEPGQKVSKQVVVRAKQPFRITQITTNNGGFEFPGATSQAAKALHVIPVTFVAGQQPAGTLVETIRIETDLGGTSAEFSAQAIIRSGDSESGEPSRPLASRREDPPNATSPVAPQSSQTTTSVENSSPETTPAVGGGEAINDPSKPEPSRRRLFRTGRLVGGEPGR